MDYCDMVESAKRVKQTPLPRLALCNVYRIYEFVPATLEQRNMQWLRDWEHRRGLADQSSCQLARLERINRGLLVRAQWQAHWGKITGVGYARS